MEKILQELSSLSGLPKEEIVDKGNPTGNKLGNELTALSGGQKLKYKPTTTSGYSALQIGAQAVDLTNTYTDPIEKYAKYNVALNPFNDWNEERARNQGTAQKWMNGLTKAGLTTLGSVYENTVGVLAGLGSVMTGGSYYDNFVGRQVDEMNTWAQSALPNYYTKDEVNGSLLSNLGTANFWADKFAGGLGYTLGSVATMWLGTGELGLSAKLGSLVAKGAQGAKIAEATGDILNVADDLAKVGANAAKAGSKEKILYQTIKGVEDAKAAGKGLEALDRYAKIKTATKHLAVGTQMSLAESSVEAREAKNSFIEERKAEWEAQNPGQAMPKDVEDAIMQSANAVGNVTFGINLPLLTATNLLMFGKAMQGARVGEKTMYDLEKKVTTAGEEWAEKAASSKFGKAYSKAQKTFGPVLKTSVEEGFQEASQFAGSQYARNYYGEKFHDGTADMSTALSKALSDTVGTKEGLENILIGALVGGGTGAVSRLRGAEKKLLAQKNINTTEAMKMLNSGAVKKAIENAEQTTENLALIKEINDANLDNEREGITKAERRQNDLRAETARMRLIHGVFAKMNGLGAIDYAMEQFDDAASMDEENFKKAFGYDMNRTLEQQTGKTQMQIIEDTKNKMQSAIKRSEQVQNILAQFNPGTSLVAKIKEGLQSEETKKNKLIQDAVRRTYGQILTHNLLDIDTIDSRIDEQYDKLVKLAPALAKLDPDEVKYQIKVGGVDIDSNGNPIFKTTASVKFKDDLGKQFNDIYAAKVELDVATADEFKFELFHLRDLGIKRAGLVESFKNLSRNPEQMDLYVEAQMALEEQAQKKAAEDRARQAIEGAETADELTDAVDPDASPEVKAAALERRAQLEEEEKAKVAQYMVMDLEDLKAIDIDSLDAMSQSALMKAMEAKTEEARKKALTPEQLKSEKEFKTVGGELAGLTELSDMEQSVLDEIMLSPNGNQFNIDGRQYYMESADPVDALILDEDGEVVGVKLTDWQTGNQVTWRIQEATVPTAPINPEDYEETQLSTGAVLKPAEAAQIAAQAQADATNAAIERETAIATLLAYNFLLQASKIRPASESDTTTLEESKAALAAAAENIILDSNEILNKEEALQKEIRDALPINAAEDLTRTAGLTKDELRYQIEFIRQDLQEIDDILAMERAVAIEAGFSMKEFKADAQVAELLTLRKRMNELIKRKIKALAAMKAAEKADLNAKEEIELSPTEEEYNTIIATANAKIQELTKEKAKLEQLSNEYQKIIDGVYGEQDVEAAKNSKLATDRKIAAKKGQITRQQNIINEVNEQRELEKRNQNGDSTTGPSSTTEGQEPQAADIDPAAGPTSEGMDGSITSEEAEAIRKAKEEALLAEEALRTGAGGPVFEAPTTNPAAPKAVVSGEANDVQLAKGTVLKKNGKVIVDLNGQTRPEAPLPGTPGYDPNYTGQMSQKIDNSPVIIFPDKLTSSEEVPVGANLEMIVAMDTDWFKSQIPADIADNPEKLYEWMMTTGWKNVPIYAALPDGTRLQLLSKYNESSPEGFKGSKRREIVQHFLDGFTPTMEVMSKFNDTSEISNARTASGKVFFYPVTKITKQPTPTLFYVGSENGDLVWKVMHDSGEANAEVVAVSSRPVRRDPNDPESKGLTPGQIAVLVQSPDGTPVMVMASTKDIDTRGATAALNHITKEIPEAYKYAQIVGCNLLEVEAKTESDEPAVENKTIADELKHAESLSKFISTYQLEDGQTIFLFYSPSAKSLVKLNGAEMKVALNGGKPSFSFVESEINEQGFIKFTSVKKEGEFYRAVENNLAEEFKAATMSKKYQVDKAKFGIQESFTSPIDGIVYEYEDGKTHPYMQYLSDSGQFQGEARTEGVGHNSILAVDTVPNSNGSVFHDVNMKFGPVNVKEATAEKAADVAANSVVTTALPKPSSPVVAESISDEDYKKFVDNGEVPVGILTYIAFAVRDRATLSPRETAIFASKTSEINKIIAESRKGVDIEAQLAESQKLVEGKTADQNYYIIGGELYKRMTNIIPDGFDGDSSLYEDSRIAGYTVDEIVKKFFDEGDTTKPEGISQGAFDMLMLKLNRIKKELDAVGGRYITRNLVVYDKETKVAGEIDILAVDKDGNFMIFDVKTSKLKGWEGYTRAYAPGQLTKKERHQLQVSGYAYLINKQFGISIKKLGIMPFEINYDSKGNITSLFNRDGIPISYAPRIERFFETADESDIERRRKQAIRDLNEEDVTSPFNTKEENDKLLKEAKEKINAEYDKELAALKASKAPKPTATPAQPAPTPAAPAVPATPVTPTVPGPPAVTPTVTSTDGIVAPKTNSAFFGSKKNVVTSQPDLSNVIVFGGGKVDVSALPDEVLAAMSQEQSLEGMATNYTNSGQNIEEICKGQTPPPPSPF
jgi:hypothetical protein